MIATIAATIIVTGQTQNGGGSSLLPNDGRQMLESIQRRALEMQRQSR